MESTAARVYFRNLDMFRVWGVCVVVFDGVIIGLLSAGALLDGIAMPAMKTEL